MSREGETGLRDVSTKALAHQGEERKPAHKRTLESGLGVTTTKQSSTRAQPGSFTACGGWEKHRIEGKLSELEQRARRGQGTTCRTSRAPWRGSARSAAARRETSRRSGGGAGTKRQRAGKFRARGEERGWNAGEVTAVPDEEHAARTKGERSKEPRGTSARRRENARAPNRGDEREMGAPWEQRRELRELEGAGDRSWSRRPGVRRARAGASPASREGHRAGSRARHGRENSREGKPQHAGAPRLEVEDDMAAGGPARAGRSSTSHREE